MVAIAAVVENIVPPAPADVVIALAAFLSERGTTTAGAVFLITWMANVAGAGLVYLLARRLGQDFFTTGIGRRLLTPEAVVVVQREYLRFGLAGLFLARLLPGIRSFTAPFAGLMRLGPVRTLIPIALASALWYGGLVLIAARIGRSWEDVTRLLDGLNRTLAVVAVLAVAGGLLWFIRHRRRLARAGLRARLEVELPSYPGLEDRALDDPAAATIAALLLETTLADRTLSPAELEVLEQHLRACWGLPAGPGAAPTDPVRVTAIVEQLTPAAREGVLRRLREAAFGDGALARHEAHVMARAARLLRLDGQEDR